MKQRDALIVEIHSLKEDHELTVNALNVTHEVSIQSLNERFENECNQFATILYVCFFCDNV